MLGEDVKWRSLGFVGVGMKHQRLVVGDLEQQKNAPSLPWAMAGSGWRFSRSGGASTSRARTSNCLASRSRSDASKGATPTLCLVEHLI